MNAGTVTPSTLAPTMDSPWRLRFWTIWIGQALSLGGSALTQFVLIWWVTQTTGSTSALAIAGIVALLPQALLGPLAGAVADRFSATRSSSGTSMQ
jgi:DHA3 family macrolide efflux protein-like MFS transporter